LEGHERAQIAIPLLADRGMFAMIPPEYQQTLCPMASGGFTLTVSPAASVRPEFVLGLLNSTLLFWRLRGISNVFRGGWITCTKQYLGELPIRIIDPKNKADQAAHDRIVKLVEQMLKLHRDRSFAKTPHEQTVLERQITATDKQIDQEVYALYGLTSEEIALVEGQTTAQPEPVASPKEPEVISVLDAKIEYPHKAGYTGHMVFREEVAEYHTNPS
jgi:hypothetical protein